MIPGIAKIMSSSGAEIEKVLDSSGNIVYQKAASIQPYLKFVGTEPFTLKTKNGKKWGGVLEYSTDGSTWTTWDGSSSVAISSTSAAPYVLYLRGTGNTTISTSGSSTYSSFVFTTAGTIQCDGRIDTLLDYQTVLNGGEPSMGEYCYYQLFEKCSVLTIPPSLPATTLNVSCYSDMFSECTNLISLPSLPATTLANACYYKMFDGCTKIKLSKTQTGEYQTPYRIPIEGTGTTAYNALSYMFSNTGGTFISTPTINTTYYTSNTVV